MILIKFAEVDLFWGRQILPNILLILTIVSTWLYIKLNRLRAESKCYFMILILSSLTPLLLLVGNEFSAYNVVWQLYLWTLCYMVEGESTGYFIFNGLWITRFAYYACGTRMTLNALCLNCGTLFYNDYHFMSWLIVMIRAVYPYIFSLFIFLIFMLAEYERRKLDLAFT